MPPDGEVYELDLPADDIADEDEKARAIQDVVNLAARRKPPKDEEETVLEISAADLDDVEKEQAVREVVELVGEKRTAKEPQLASELPTGDPADELEKARAVREVVEGAIRFTREVAAAKPMESYQSRPIVLAAIAIPCLILATYTVAARPEWVFGPDPAQEAPARREAHLRFTMFLVAQRLYAYRDANRGQLPQSLQEIGEDWPGIIYRNAGGSVFELRSADALVPTITFQSEADATALLGSSRSHLREQSQ